VGARATFGDSFFKGLVAAAKRIVVHGTDSCGRLSVAGLDYDSMVVSE
jgi:hypothetical protein